MKFTAVFGTGAASGMIVALLWFASSRVHPSKEAEIATLREDLSHAQKAAKRDGEALRATQQELQLLRDAREPKSSSSFSPAAPIVASSDSAISNYLGSPVPAPADLDHRYSAKELSATFRDLSETLGFKIEKLAIDTTEFPFVVHGLVQGTAGGDFFKKIDAELRALPGYTYGGSVTGRTKDGSTYFALNMTPSSAYPREQAEAIRRRLMLRLQMAAAAWTESPP